MKTFSIVVVGAALIEFLLLPLYVRLKRKKYNQKIKLFIKALNTFIAVVFCFLGILEIYKQTGDINNLKLESGFETNLLILAGIFICMIADVILGINFGVGIVFFLLGHICYVAYFISLGGLTPWSIPVFIIPAIIAYIYFSRYKKSLSDKKTTIVFFVYGGFILVTFSIGIMLPFTVGEYGILPAIAAVMLVISDYMLALNTVTKKKMLDDLIYLGYYFSGQYIMALSVFVPVFMNL